MRTLLPTLLLGALVASVPATSLATQEREGLEARLERLRRERESRTAGLAERVDSALETIQLLFGQARPDRMAALRHDLAKLGPESVRFLLPEIDPGAEATPERLFRAEQAALVLAELATPVATDRLLEIARSGSLPGRCNALRALTSCREPQRAIPAVRGIYQSAEGDVRREALLTLAQLSGERAGEIFKEALSGDDPKIIDLALEALASQGTLGVTDEILTLVRRADGPDHVPALLAYYDAVPGVLDQEHFLALLALARERSVGPQGKVDILERLRRVDVSANKDVRREAEPLADAPFAAVAEAARVLLARLGDKSARRDLLRPYDERIARSRNASSALSARGDVYCRIGEYNAAIKDYKRALRETGNRNRDAGPFVGLARCYALQRRFKDAAEYLNLAPIDIEELRRLASDPDFVELREDPKYGKTLRFDP